jgi:hypothetical protein
VSNISEPRRLKRQRWRDCGAWLLCGALNSAVVFIGVSVGKTFVHDKHPGGTFADALSNWDGEFFNNIVKNGYFYDPTRGSTVAFYPAYPLAAKGLALATGLSPAAALAIVANVCCFAAFVLMGVYLKGRRTESASPRPSPVNVEDEQAKGRFPALSESSGQAERDASGTRPSARALRPEENAPVTLEESDTVGRPCHNAVASYALLAMGLLPTTFFFRMAYTESMFLCAAIFAMLAIARRWPLPIVGALVGLATATRPVGIALLLPLVWYAWQISTTKRQFALRLAYAVPLGCWGLIAFVAYQYLKFGEPLAFVLTQKHWHIRTVGTFSDKLASLASWEPIWGAYVPGSPGYFREPEGIGNPLFSLQAANPIYFVGTAALIAAGAWKRWLTTEEVLFAAAVVAIPYLTRGYEMSMASQGRFAAVAFPVYIVLGHLLARLPTVVTGAVLAFSGFLMAAYAALFAAGYSLI